VRAIIASIGTPITYIVTAWIRALMHRYGFRIINRRLISWITSSKNSTLLVFSIARGLILSKGPSNSKSPSTLAVSLGEEGLTSSGPDLYSESSESILIHSVLVSR
jgi:hypothetical protein